MAHFIRKKGEGEEEKKKEGKGEFRVQFLQLVYLLSHHENIQKQRLLTSLHELLLYISG